ncbi:hypothetical protein PTKIN_Ptkin02bG0157500 [Pterospermum kingtungense]
MAVKRATREWCCCRDRHRNRTPPDVNILSAVRSFENGSDVFDGIFRCYAVVIAFFVVLAETEWGFIIKFWKVLQYWSGRGMLQIFKPEGPCSSSEHSKLYAPCLCHGVLLRFDFHEGFLCIGFLKRSRQKKELTREQAIKDLEELEQRREELQQLLLADRV